MSGKPIVYWDSCAFIAFLKGEACHGDDVSAALKSQAGAFDRGEIVLATSTIGIAEVISANLGSAVQDELEGIVRRKNFHTIPVNDTIARDAARLRTHCHKAARASSTGDPYLLAMPDAVHVVSAMRIGAAVLVTLDKNDKSVTASRRELGMTSVARFYPVPDLHPVPIQLPAVGLPGTGLF